MSMDNIDEGLVKFSRSTFIKDENIYHFVRDNLHTTQDIVSFYRGGWANFLDLGEVPKDYYRRILNSLIEAWENKDPYLDKVLTPANIRKIILGNNSDINQSLALSSPSFISSNPASPGGVVNCLAVELKDFDFKKINHKDKLDSRFYSLLVGLTAFQFINQKVATDLRTIDLEPRFAADVLKEMDVIFKSALKKDLTVMEKSNFLYFSDIYVRSINCSKVSEDYYKYLDKEFLSQEAYANSWTGNYTHLILASALDTCLYEEKENADVSLKEKFKYLKDKCLHASIATKNEKDECLDIYLQDLFFEKLLPLTLNDVSDSQKKVLNELLELLDKEFSYLKRNPHSIEKMFMSLENFSEKNVNALSDDNMNRIIDFFDFNEVKKNAKKRGYAPASVNKKILNDVLGGGASDNLDSNESYGFKI